MTKFLCLGKVGIHKTSLSYPQVSPVKGSGVAAVHTKIQATGNSQKKNSIIYRNSTNSGTFGKHVSDLLINLRYLFVFRNCQKLLTLGWAFIKI